MLRAILKEPIARSFYYQNSECCHENVPFGDFGVRGNDGNVATNISDKTIINNSSNLMSRVDEIGRK